MFDGIALPGADVLWVWLWPWRGGPGSGNVSMCATMGVLLILMNRFVFRGETRPLPHSRYRNTDTHNGFPSTHAHSAPAKMSADGSAADWPFEPSRYCWLMLARNADTHKVSAHSSQ